MAENVKTERRKFLGMHDWEEIYQKSPDNLPWDSGIPDPNLVEFIESQQPRPEHALEIGCGTGTNAIWMAEKGIRVTATDYSQTAVDMANKKLGDKKLPVSFKAADITKDAPIDGAVDFVFDRGVYHVMESDQRAGFIKRVADALKNDGYWLCLAGSADEVRENPDMGPPQLLASELVDLAEKHFAIIKLERTKFSHPSGMVNMAWRVLYQKR